MIEPGDRAGLIGILKQGDAEFLSRATGINLVVLARGTACAGQGLAGLWITGNPLIVNTVTKMLGADVLLLMIQIDQEVAAWIKVNVTVREGMIQRCQGVGIGQIKGGGIDHSGEGKYTPVKKARAVSNLRPIFTD